MFVPHDAHSLSTLIGTTPRNSSQLGDEELKDNESPLSSLQNASEMEDEELHLGPNRRTGVLQFLLLPLRLIGSLESEHGCDFGLFLDDEQLVKMELMKTSGVNSSRLTDRLIPDRIVKTTPFMLGSDFIALFNGCRGFLGVILPEDSSLGSHCGVTRLTSFGEVLYSYCNVLTSTLAIFLKVRLSFKLSFPLKREFKRFY